MINHARTLLMNRSGGKQNLRDLGEEFIPTDFVEQSLPAWLRSYHQILFGSNPENVYLNMQIAKLLRLVHATEYEPYLLLFDRRLTYDPQAVGPFATLQYGYSLVSAASKFSELLQVGQVAADESAGVARYKWSMRITSQIASIENLRSGASSTAALVSPLGADASVSEIFVLPGTAFRVRLRKKTTPYAAADWSDAAEVTLLTRPTRTLSDAVSSLEQLRENETKLFGRDNVEPYRTFFGLWRNAQTLPERLTGLVLALVFRLHANYRES